MYIYRIFVLRAVMYSVPVSIIGKKKKSRMSFTTSRRHESMNRKLQVDVNRKGIINNVHWYNYF